jgi:hemerythrin
MEYAWNESFAVGQETIDEQHKKLFTAINDLIQVSNKGEIARDELKKSLDFLNDYTIQHFFDEEQIQLKYQYPDYENHKKLHESCKKALHDLMVEWIMKGSSGTLLEGVKVKVADWLVNHIKTQDTRIGAHIKGKNP